MCHAPSQAGFLTPRHSRFTHKQGLLEKTPDKNPANSQGRSLPACYRSESNTHKRQEREGFEQVRQGNGCNARNRKKDLVQGHSEQETKTDSRARKGAPRTHQERPFHGDLRTPPGLTLELAHHRRGFVRAQSAPGGSAVGTANFGSRIPALTATEHRPSGVRVGDTVNDSIYKCRVRQAATAPPPSPRRRLPPRALRSVGLPGAG